jgi:protein-S-isoprenylcysteine O-methyltransferase Ste14
MIKWTEKNMMSETPWWKGKHGEWYVVSQVVLIVLILFGPRNFPGCPIWTAPFTWLSSVAGGIFLLIGLIPITLAIIRMGSNLTAMPYPNEQGTLIEAGPYRLVRHPMYCGLILIAFGWALLVHGWLTIGYAIIMLVFLDIKSRREEYWLKAKFTRYDDYQKRVHKLIPFLY